MPLRTTAHYNGTPPIQIVMSYITTLRKKIGKGLLQIPSVAGLIRDAQGRLLFVRKSEDGAWGLPAGAIEPGETPKEAVIREIYEETGLRVRSGRIAGIFGGAAFRHTYPNGDQVEYVVTLIVCEIIERGTPADSEIVEVKFFDREKMPTIALPYPIEVLYGDGLECVGN